MENFVDDVFSTDRLIKKTGLERLLIEIQRTRGNVAISNINRFFLSIQESLLETDQEIVIMALQILYEIIPVSYK